MPGMEPGAEQFTGSGGEGAHSVLTVTLAAEGGRYSRVTEPYNY